MFFDLPIKTIGTIDHKILEKVNNLLIQYENSNNYVFEFQNWQRLDSYNNPKKFNLSDIVGQEIIDVVMKHFPKHMLYGWSLSYLPGKTKILDHVDRMMLHRFAMRIIVPVSDTPDVLNWHYSKDKITKRHYILDYGNIYRLNTAVTHGLENNNVNPRRAVYFDVMPQRLYEKFKDNFEIEKVILLNASGEIHVL